MNKILVINNDMEAMQLLKTWLENKGYEVKITGRKEDVLELMGEFMPDLVMADVLHAEAVDELKANDATKQVPILLMSGYTKGQENLRLDVEDIIEKPFNFPLLTKKIGQLMKERA